MLKLPISAVKLNDENPRTLKDVRVGALACCKDNDSCGNNKNALIRLLMCALFCIFSITKPTASMAYTCQLCASEFMPKKPNAPAPKYCSRSCAGVASRGRVVSEETKGKQRKALTGRTCPATTGEKHPMWKGGVTKPNEASRKSAPFKHWRVAVFTRDTYTCQHCQRKGGHLHAHHIQPFAKFPELRTEVGNGITLCDECHGKVHGLVFSNKPANTCPDCKKRIKAGAKRCRSCSMAHTKANGPKCLGCATAVKVRGSRCRSCAAVIRIAKTGHVNFWIKKNA